MFVHGILGGIFITWRQQRESDFAPPPSSPKKNGAKTNGNGNGAKKVEVNPQISNKNNDWGQKLNFEESNPDLHNSFYEEGSFEF